MEIQGFLPGMEEPRDIAGRLLACRDLFAVLRISKKRVREILQRPHAYWNRVVLHKNGKARVCYSPNPYLRYVQRMLYRLVRNDDKCKWLIGGHNAYPATAFWHGSSIVHNARFHRHNRSSWCIDLKDAFASILTKALGGYLLRMGVFTRVCRGWTTTPITVSPTDAAWVCSRLLTFQGRLRQGAPVAQFLFNLMLGRLDEDLAKIVGAPTRMPEKHEAHWPEHLRKNQPEDPSLPWEGPYQWIRVRQRGPRYTRYGDDLCFSVPDETFPNELKERIRQCIHDHGYHLSTHKQGEGRHGVMEFPGCVVVHGAIRPPHAYLHTLAESLQTNALSLQELRGHAGFLGQFRSGVWKRCLRAEGISPQVITRLG